LRMGSLGPTSAPLDRQRSPFPHPLVLACRCALRAPILRWRRYVIPSLDDRATLPRVTACRDEPIGRRYETVKRLSAGNARPSHGLVGFHAAPHRIACAFACIARASTAKVGTVGP